MTYQNPQPLTFTAQRLAGRVIFVTGASSGIGRAAVMRFGAEGATVVAASRRIDRLEVLAREQCVLGRDVTAMACDVRDEDSVSNAIAQTIEKYGRLDGAFNNAGMGGGHGPVHEADAAIFDRIIATNLRGVLLCMKHEIPALQKSGGGSIVNTSSIGGLVGGPGNAIYAASKWGLAGLTKCAALDYARQNIRVNAIAPGPTESEMFNRWMHTEEMKAAMADHFPMNYIAHPDDMARAALFLLSDEARWVTGVILPCDGGKSAS